MSRRKSEHTRDKNYTKDAENHKMKNSTKRYHFDEIKECATETCSKPECTHFASVKACEDSGVEEIMTLTF
jgi:hypothetical protein